MEYRIVKVEYQRVTLALTRFGLGLQQRAELLRTIGLQQLRSIYKTFDEQGSPAGSWAPLSPRTLADKKSKATGGRKILILSGRLRNSITSEATDTGVVIGTNLVYARVQQEGSADRRGAAIGPQARIAGRSVMVGKNSRTFQREIHYGTRQVIKDGKAFHVPVAMRTGGREITDKRGRNTKVRSAFQGPRNQLDVHVSEHQAFQNIPARPYIVVRPEDPGLIQDLVIHFAGRQAAQAGLDTTGGL